VSGKFANLHINLLIQNAQLIVTVYEAKATIIAQLNMDGIVRAHLFLCLRYLLNEFLHTPLFNL